MRTKQWQRTIYIALFCLLGLLPAACKSTGSLADGSTSAKPGREARDFVSLAMERSVFLYPDEPDTSPKLDITLSLLDITNPEKQFILDVLYDGQTPREYAEKRLHGYDSMYGEMSNLVKKNPYMSQEALSWFYAEAFKYDAGTSRIAVISREREYYTGGAHGMRDKDYYVFSLEDKRQLKLGDIVREEAKPALDELVEVALRKLMEIPDWIPLTERSFFENPVDKLEDFFVSSQGLGFQWDPFEIAPYSVGLIEIVLPYDQLNGIFTELGLSLIKDLR